MGFNRFGFFSAVVACISCLAHSMRTLPCSSAIPMPPICESSKHSKFSLISVISPIGSDLIGNSSSTSGCSVVMGGGWGVATGGTPVTDGCEMVGVADGNDVASGEVNVG